MLCVQEKQMNPNKIYNRILDFIGFVLTILFVVGQLLGWFHVSWWWILFPLFAPSLFHADESEDNDNDNNNYRWA